MLAPPCCSICSAPVAAKNRSRPGPRFCSVACYSVKRKGTAKREKLTACLGCKAALGLKQFRFCSNACQQAHRKASHWSAQPWTARRRKQFLIETGGRRCSSCGLEEWQGQPIPLELHHLGDSSSHAESVLLRVMCHACTPTFRNKNRGNGRHARRVRYAAGQSY